MSHPGAVGCLLELAIRKAYIMSHALGGHKLVPRHTFPFKASRRSRPGEPLLISKVIPGSVASRCGSISPGDILLAVNGVSLEACSITDAARLLQTSEEIVTLRIKKPDEEPGATFSDEGFPSCPPSDANNDEIGGDVEYLSQSADEMAPSPQLATRARHRALAKRMQQKPMQQQQPQQQYPRIKKIPSASRMLMMQGQQQSTPQGSEGGSDSRRQNPSDSLSSDRFSENVSSGKWLVSLLIRLFSYAKP